MFNLKNKYHENGNKKEEIYLLNNKRHKENGPAHIIYYLNGSVFLEHYYFNDKLHNDNGPAMIHYHENGNKYLETYCFNNKYLENVNSLKELQRYIKLNNIS